jgi:acyl carrier protein
MQIEQKVKELVAEQACVELSTVENESTFADLGFDSLDSVELMCNIEDEYDITVEDDAVENIDNVQGLIDLVRNLTPA